MNETSDQFPPKPSTKSRKIGSMESQYYANIQQRSSVFSLKWHNKSLEEVTTS